MQGKALPVVSQALAVDQGDFQHRLVVDNALDRRSDHQRMVAQDRLPNGREVGAILTRGRAVLEQLLRLPDHVLVP